jgi:hypothetical protein
VLSRVTGTTCVRALQGGSFAMNTSFPPALSKTPLPKSISNRKYPAVATLPLRRVSMYDGAHEERPPTPLRHAVFAPFRGLRRR